MQDTPDPVSYLLSEIAAYDAGTRPNWESWQREHYLDVILDEAGLPRSIKAHRGVVEEAD